MFSTKYLSVLTTLGIFTALFSIIFQAYLASNDLQRLTTILTNLVWLENYNKTYPTSSVPLINQPKIAVGYGSCSDLYVDSSFLNFTEFLLKNDPNNNNTNDDDDDDDEEITDEQQLLKSFAHYFQHGAAAE